jgi:hypothetical protein
MCDFANLFQIIFTILFGSYCFPCKVLESKEGGPRLEEIAAVFGAAVATQGRARSATMNYYRRLRGQGTRAWAAAPRR